MDLVSIIMPCFNSDKFIEQSIRSVIDQSYINWELLVCDDGSTDNTMEILKSLMMNDSRIKFFTNHYSRGAAGARNTSLDYSTGRYIAFLDSDDVWYKDKLREQISFMEKKQVAFSFTYYDIMDENSFFLGSYKAPKVVNSCKMKISNFIPCLTAIYDTKILKKVYQPEIKKRNDFALWLKILNGGVVKNAYCLPKVTAKYRVNSYGLSSSKLDSFFFYRQCLVNYGKCSKSAASFYSTIYLLIVIIKKKSINLYNWLTIRL